MILSDIQSLMFEITSHCNIRCPQCSRAGQNGQLAEYLTLSHWDVDSILPNLEIEKLINLKNIHIEGDNGDALMHPKLETILDTFYNAPTQPTITILTHGAIRSPNWWKKIGQKYQGRLIVQFSIDGLEDTHKLYRVGADYTKAVENARAYISAGGVADQRCILFKHNEHQIAEITQVSKDIGFERLVFILNDVSRFGGQDTWQVIDSSGVGLHHIQPTKLTTTRNTGFDNRTKTVTKKQRTTVTTEICPSLRTGEIYVSYKGHILPCCAYHSDLYFNVPSNADFQQLVGDIDQIDLNKRKLSDIFDDSEFYYNRLSSGLLASKDFGRCNTMCGNVLPNLVKWLVDKKSDI